MTARAFTAAYFLTLACAVAFTAVLDWLLTRWGRA